MNSLVEVASINADPLGVRYYDSVAIDVLDHEIFRSDVLTIQTTGDDRSLNKAFVCIKSSHS